jgi:hypothetical protein
MDGYLSAGRHALNHDLADARDDLADAGDDLALSRVPIAKCRIPAEAETNLSTWMDGVDWSPNHYQPVGVFGGSDAPRDGGTQQDMRISWNQAEEYEAAADGGVAYTTVQTIGKHELISSTNHPFQSDLEDDFTNPLANSNAESVPNRLSDRETEFTAELKSRLHSLQTATQEPPPAERTPVSQLVDQNTSFDDRINSTPMNNHPLADDLDFDTNE